jgi:YbbR domain-containing protein
MIKLLREFIKSIPTLLLSLALAIAVWISAVNASDPVVQRVYPKGVTIERRGLASSLVISGDVPTQVTVTLSAPSSVWDRILNGKNPIIAWINLAGLSEGEHTVDVQVRSMIPPSKEVTYSPRPITLTLEKLVSKEFPVRVVQRGEPAIGYRADAYQLNPDSVTITGASSVVAKVKEVRVTVDLTQASDNFHRTLDVEALDETGAPVDGVTVTPAQVTINQPISQLGGYRNVVVKVASTGQVASGYRLTNISVFPPTVTVFSNNPLLVDRLPGYVETSPLDLTGVKDNIDFRLPLNLPDGVEVVGSQTVLVQVGVAPIEGSVTLSGLTVQVQGLPENNDARISPATVDVIVSGPVPLLDKLTEQDVRVYLDLSGVSEGTFKFAPK